MFRQSPSKHLTVQWIWLVPSLGFGLYLGFGTGNWLAGGFAIAGAAGYLAFALGQHFRAPILPTDAVSYSEGHFYLGRRRLPRLELLWKLDWYDRVFAWVQSTTEQAQARIAAQAMRSGDLRIVQNLPRELRLWLGFTGTKPRIFDLVTDGPHALIVGPTGVGKSQLLAIAVEGVVQSCASTELALALIDFKGGATLTHWFGRPNVFATATDLSGNIGEMFGWLGEQLAHRERYLAQLGASRIDDLPAGQQIPRLLVVVDELQVVLREAGAQVIDDIAARGRSLGMHLIATAQGASGLSRGLLANIGMRIAIGVNDPIDLAQLGLRQSANPIDAVPAPLWRTARFVSSTGHGEFVFPIGVVAPSKSGNA